MENTGLKHRDWTTCRIGGRFGGGKGKFFKAVKNQDERNQEVNDGHTQCWQIIYFF